MGSRKLRRLLWRKPSPTKSSTAKQSVDAEARTPGLFLLRQFIASLGPRTQASLGRGWVRGGTTVHAANEWDYNLRQGRDVLDLTTIRQQLNDRLIRTGGRLQAGGWTRLLLGPEYTVAPTKKQTHVLNFVIAYCPCINCRIDAMRGDLGMEDVDEMLLDAERGEGFAEMEVQRSAERVEEDDNDPLFTARKSARFGELPSVDAFKVIGESLGSHEFELGIISRINGKGCRVNFAPFAKQFFDAARYCGPLDMAEVSESVAGRAKEYYKKHKGKTERRFYVQGTLVKFMVDGCGVALTRIEEGVAEEITSIGVLFRKQVMSVFIGQLALEDSFGSFIHTDTSFYIGFSQDSEGAQTVFSDGTLGKSRHLGINELRTHLQIESGDELRIKMR